MRYCITYNKKDLIHLLDKVDEIKIKFQREDTTLPLFLETYCNKTIIIELTEIKPEDLKLLIALNDKYDSNNIHFCMSYTKENEYIWKMLAANNCKFFFTDHVRDYEILFGFLNMGVSYVYITDILGFELPNVSTLAHKFGTLIRVFPDVAQSSFGNFYDVASFFIRPEDIHYYEGYVDVCEFFDLKKQPTLLKAYKDDEEWFGPLKEIISNFNSELDGRYIVSMFAEQRLKCNKKCVKGKQCRICYHLEDFSEKLKENNIVVRQFI